MRGLKKSFRILQLRRLLDIRSLAELPNVRPRSVEIRGNRLDLTSKVELNNTDAPAFAALSPERLLVQVPSGIKGPIMEVAVFSNYLEPGSRSLASYDFTNHLWIAEGKSRVLQNFIKLLLTTPGTDIWSPRTGGGLMRLLVRNVDRHSENAISGEIESRVMSVTRQLIEAQSLDHTISVAERLMGSVVDRIIVSTAEQAVTVDLTLKFQDGGRASTRFGW